MDVACLLVDFDSTITLVAVSEPTTLPLLSVINTVSCTMLVGAWLTTPVVAWGRMIVLAGVVVVWSQKPPESMPVSKPLRIPSIQVPEHCNAVVALANVIKTCAFCWKRTATACDAHSGWVGNVFKQNFLPMVATNRLAGQCIVESLVDTGLCRAQPVASCPRTAARPIVQYNTQTDHW